MVQLGYTFLCDGNSNPNPKLQLPPIPKYESEDDEMKLGSGLHALLLDYCGVRTNPDLIQLVKSYPDQNIFKCNVAIESLPRKAFELGFFEIDSSSSSSGCERLHFKKDSYDMYCSLEKIIDDVRCVHSSDAPESLQRLMHIDKLMDVMADLLPNAGGHGRSYDL